MGVRAQRGSAKEYEVKEERGSKIANFLPTYLYFTDVLNNFGVVGAVLPTQL
jgi:hypothetical protein